jgi:hypothetical protein
MKRLFLIAVILAGTTFGQVRPQVTNGRLVEQKPDRGLAGAVAALMHGTRAAWLAYSVPSVPGEHLLCCWNARSEFRGNAQCCGGCRLESSNGDNFVADRLNGCQPPDADTFFVLVRVSPGGVDKVRAASADCGLDLGGLDLYWLGPVAPAQSVAWLSGVVERGDRLGDGAMTAIALTADVSAEVALQRLMAPQQPREQRERAAFWLGNARGQRGFEMLRDAIRNEQDAKVRAEATFALAQSKVPAAQQELIRLAHQDPDGEVRGQALFWLAQEPGLKVAKAITDAIDDDPDSAVKKKAVFALSQMDRDEGVPLLIQVAKSNRSFTVRKEAIFWLGQSNDPRALDFIESILKQ